MEKRIKELQKKETQLWKELEHLLDEKQRNKVAKLIEINLELENLSNQ